MNLSQYLFTLSSSNRTIDVSAISNVSVGSVLMIVDETSNKVLYSKGNDTLSTISIASNTLTLSALPSGQGDSTNVSIIYNDAIPRIPVYNNISKEIKSQSITAVGALAAIQIPVGCNTMLVKIPTGLVAFNVTFQTAINDVFTVPVSLIARRKDTLGTAIAGAQGTTTGYAFYEVDVAGLEGDWFRLNITALTSGTTTAKITPTSAPVSFVGIASTTQTSISSRASANATDGASTYHRLISAASTNATSVKTTAGQISMWYVKNRSAVERFYKIYNKTSAPVVGTDVPVFTIPLAPGETFDLVANGWTRMSSGIAYAITANLADTDATAVAAGDIVVNIVYT